MKRILAVILTAVVTAFSLSGCVGDTMPVSIVLINATEHELEKIIFQIPPRTGSYSPMHYLVNDGDESLKPGEERELITHMYKQDFSNQGWALVFIKGDEKEYSYHYISVESDKNNRFEITCDDSMNFTFKTTDETV